MNNITRLDINEYWQIIFKRRYLFIAVSLIVLSVVVWGSFLIPEIYEAECTVFIERSIIDNLIKDIAITPSLEDSIAIMSYSMKSRSLLLKVIEELDLDIDGEQPVDIEKLVKNFQQKTKIKTIKKRGATDLFTVSYRDRNPKIARDYVNALVRRYIEEKLSAKREESYEANRFIAEQLRFFRKKLDKAEKKITDFRKNKGIFIAINEARIVGDIRDTQDKLERFKVERLELEAKKNLIENQLKKEKPYTVAILGKTTGDSLNNRVLMLQNKLYRLLVKYTENYPEVIKVRAEIETLQKQLQNSPEEKEEMQGTETEMTTLNPLYQQLKEGLAKIDVELAALSAKEKHLAMLIVSKKTYLKDIPIEKKKLGDLERERNTYKKIDGELVIKLGQSEVSKQMEIQDKTETFRIVDPALLPKKPVGPDRVKFILLGLIAGLIGGFGIVFLLENMDNSIKTADELKASFKLPVIAEIPKIITPEDIIKSKKIDITVYAVSIAYLSVIVALFVKEVINRF